jgi:hypothetical protein
VYRFVADDPRKIFVRDRFQVVMAESDTVLAQVIRTRFAGGWLRRAFGGLWGGRGNGGICELSNPIEIQQRLITETLIPMKEGS